MNFDVAFEKLIGRGWARRIADACRWSEAIETVLATNLRLLFAWQRVALRSIWRL